MRLSPVCVYILLLMLLVTVGDFAVASGSDQTASAKSFQSGKAKMLKGNYRGAIEDYTQAISLDPDNALAYVNRGCTYNCLKDDHNALLDYQKAILVNPDLAIAYYNRASQFRRLGKLSLALSDHTKAISLDPEYANAFYGRAWVQKMRGNKPEAISDYMQASRLYAAQGRDIAAYESKVRAAELR